MLPSAVYFVIVWRILHSKPTEIKSRNRIILIGFTLLFHSTLLFTPDPLSNDLYRYFWDGKILSQGINPYTFSPSANELAPYRDVFWEQIFNRNVPTGYPPLIESIFALSYRLFPNPWSLRCLALLASVGTSICLMWALKLTGRDERRSILYAWAPLVALEFANSGHLDAFALLCLSAALVFSIKHNTLGTAVCLALGGLIKFFPMLLAPFWSRNWGYKTWGGFILVSLLPWLPFLAGGSPFKGLGIFGVRGDFNGGLYRLIEYAWYSLTGWSTSPLLARASVIILPAIFYIDQLRRRYLNQNPLPDWKFSAALFGFILILSPVVHPWYICWMLAFVTIEGNLAWLGLSTTMIFARHVYIGYEQTGIWQEAWWISPLVWIPFFLAFFFFKYRSKLVFRPSVS